MAMQSTLGSSATDRYAAAASEHAHRASAGRRVRTETHPAAQRAKVNAVFVVGPPRSGTTLLSYLLGGGDSLLSISEPFLAHAIYPHWRLRWFFSRLRGPGAPRPARVPRNTDPDGLFAFLVDLAGNGGLSHLVIKETYRAEREWANVDLMERIAREHGAIAGITRHPYDAAVSTLRFCRRWRGLAGRLIRCWVPNLPLFADDAELIRHFAENWTGFVRWTRRFELNVVRYEDLVTRPRETLTGVCQQCGLPFREEMLDHRHPRTAFGGLGAPEVMSRPPKPVNTQSVGRADLLAPKHREILKQRCAAAAAELGYCL